MQQDFNTDFEKVHGVPLSFLSFFTVAASKALQEFPMANASIEDNEIVYRDYADIGVTMAAPNGTVTPVIRNVGSLTFREVE
jgi:2-oxoglutarate dehydrogenase E2 component (dihydrolipoamide succinyltransferase)